MIPIKDNYKGPEVSGFELQSRYYVHFRSNLLGEM